MKQVQKRKRKKIQIPGPRLLLPWDLRHCPPWDPAVRDAQGTQETQWLSSEARPPNPASPNMQVSAPSSPTHKPGFLEPQARWGDLPAWRVDFGKHVGNRGGVSGKLLADVHEKTFSIKSPFPWNSLGSWSGQKKKKKIGFNSSRENIIPCCKDFLLFV